MALNIVESVLRALFLSVKHVCVCVCVRVQPSQQKGSPLTPSVPNGKIGTILAPVTGRILFDLQTVWTVRVETGEGSEDLHLLSLVYWNDEDQVLTLNICI